uniref:Uncharacterized protein n=1 Tax=Oryza barthii TaxID=65489 RepID=A0A0D3GZ30_9ORYZ
MRTLGLEKKPARVLNTDDIPLCHSRCSQSEGCEGAVVDESVRRVAMVDVVEIGRASWTKVHENTLETKTVTQSRQSLGKMTLKSRCRRTVKDKTLRRVCQT